jgi:hypothetical protein
MIFALYLIECRAGVLYTKGYSGWRGYMLYRLLDEGKEVEGLKSSHRCSILYTLVGRGTTVGAPRRLFMIIMVNIGYNVLTDTKIPAREAVAPDAQKQAVYY